MASLLQEGIKPTLKEVLVPKGIGYKGRKRKKRSTKFSNDAVKMAMMMKGM